MKYGVNTYPNILQGLPPSIPLYVVVLLVTIQLCMTSAVSNSALYQHIEDYFNIPRGKNPISYNKSQLCMILYTYTSYKTVKNLVVSMSIYFQTLTTNDALFDLV